MPNFTIRVELYGTPAEAVYNNLHTAMAQRGFLRSFTENGKKYDMPHAMYCCFNNNNSTIQIVELARQASTSVWKDCAVLATSTMVRFEYYNLKLSK